MASQTFGSRRLVRGSFPLRPFKKLNYGGKKIIEEKRKGFRTRPYSYSFRVSVEEKQLLERKVKASGLNKTDYLIKCLSDKPIVTVPSDLLLELKRQGNNLNQVVKNCYCGRTTEQELLSCVDLCKRLYGKLLSAIGES